MAETKLQLIIQAVDQASATLNGINKGLAPLHLSLTKIGVAMSAFGAGIVASLGMATKSALDEEIGINRLSVALQNVGVNYSSLRGEIEATLAATQKKTNYGDEEQRDALVRLVGITGTYQGALQQLQIAIDLAAAKNMDLNTAAMLVGRVVTGNTELLSRYGIQVKEGATATEVLADMQDRFAGAAQGAANPLTQLTNMFGELAQDIGKTLVPLLRSMVDVILPVIDSIRNWIKEHPELTKGIVLVTAAIGGLASVIGPLLIMLPAIAAGFAILTGPVGLVIVAVVALAAGAVLLIANWDKVSIFFQQVWANIKIYFLQGVDNVLASLQRLTNFIPALKDKVTEARENLANLLEAEKIQKDAIGVQQSLTETVPAIAGVGQAAKQTAVDVEKMSDAMIKNQIEADRLNERFQDLMAQINYTGSEAEKYHLTMFNVYDALAALGYKTEEIRVLWDKWGEDIAGMNGLLQETGLTVTDIAKALDTELTPSLGTAGKAAGELGTALGAISTPPIGPQITTHTTPQQRLKIMQDLLADFEARIASGVSSSTWVDTGQFTGMLGAVIQQLREQIEIWKKLAGVEGYASGGIVPQTGLAYLHKGEAVIPEGAGLGGVTVNIAGPNFLDNEESLNKLARKIRDAINRTDRLAFGNAYSGG